MAALSVTAACSNDTGASDGTSVTVNVQRMDAAWASGRCSATDSGWGGYVQGLTVPSQMPTAGHVALVPTSVDRIVMCRFSEANGELTGSALVTTPATVTRFVAELNSAVASTAACIGSQSVELLLGTGNAVMGINLAMDGCTTLASPAGEADYGKTSLGGDVDRVLTAGR
jgi:hypothetical protein